MKYLILSFVIVLTPVVSHANCASTAARLKDRVDTAARGARARCDRYNEDPAGKTACLARACATWDSVRYEFQVEIARNTICSEIISERFSQFLTRAEAVRVQCGSPTTVTTLPPPDTCQQGVVDLSEALEALSEQLPSTSCGDCIDTCAALREYQSRRAAITPACRTIVRDRLKESDPGIGVRISNLNTFCDGKGL